MEFLRFSKTDKVEIGVHTSYICTVLHHRVLMNISRIADRFIFLSLLGDPRSQLIPPLCPSGRSFEKVTPLCPDPHSTLKHITWMCDNKPPVGSCSCVIIITLTWPEPPGENKFARHPPVLVLTPSAWSWCDLLAGFSFCLQAWSTRRPAAWDW